ncbi:MAG: hypothetical protein J5501_05415 [Ruminococcus sp.]|nr:hypothetical protein [Ruminococcus sp.]
MEEKKNYKKPLLIAAAAVLLVIIAVAGIFTANRYASEHYRAVVYVAGESHGETDEAFEGQQICGVGQQITAGRVILKVTKIDWKESVSFETVQGDLRDSSEDAVTGDTLAKGERKYYHSSDTSFSVAIRRIEKD